MFALYILNYPLTDSIYFWHVRSISYEDLKKGKGNDGASTNFIGVNFQYEKLDFDEFNAPDFVIDIDDKKQPIKKTQNSEDAEDINLLLKYINNIFTRSIIIRRKFFIDKYILRLHENLKNVIKDYNETAKNDSNVAYSFFYMNQSIFKINRRIQEIFYDFVLNILVELNKDYIINESTKKENTKKIDEKISEEERIFIKFTKNTVKYGLYFKHFIKSFITQDELNAKVRRYGELELSENTEKKDIDEYIYWNYVALEQSNVKQKDDIFAKLENALDVLCTRDLKKYFKSSSVLKYARSKKYYDRSLEVIRQFADDFSKINEDNFVSSCVPVYIPSAITFFVDQLFIDGTPNWQDLSSISRLFLMPIKYFEEQLQIQIDDYDDEENILYLESLRTIFESSFNVYHPSLIYAEASSVIKGVPGNVAYRIGNAYMRGKDLPLDKSKARQWFSYGMVVGDPFCTMAFIVYFMDLSIDSEMESESELTDLYTLLINCFALVRYIKTT
ncbi:hypothetical protein II654_02540, partial [bacterium]|nr:hypothetical protein [bacterium]